MIIISFKVKPKRNCLRSVESSGSDESHPYIVESHQSYANYNLSSKFHLNTLYIRFIVKEATFVFCPIAYRSCFIRHFFFVFITFIKILWTCKIGQKLVWFCFVVLLPSCLYKNIDVCRATEKFSCICCLLLVFLCQHHQKYILCHLKNTFKYSFINISWFNFLLFCSTMFYIMLII